MHSFNGARFFLYQKVSFNVSAPHEALSWSHEIRVLNHGHSQPQKSDVHLINNTYYARRIVYLPRVSVYHQFSIVKLLLHMFHCQKPNAHLWSRVLKIYKSTIILASEPEPSTNPLTVVSIINCTSFGLDTMQIPQTQAFSIITCIQWRSIYFIFQHLFYP